MEVTGDKDAVGSKSSGSSGSSSSSSSSSEGDAQLEQKSPAQSRRKRRITYDSLFTVKKSILTFISFWKTQLSVKREIEPKYLTLKVRFDQPYESKSKEDVLVSM
jgi:hypothetical protein